MKKINHGFSYLISNTKEPEKNLRKLFQGACGPKRVNSVAKLLSPLSASSNDKYPLCISLKNQ